MTLLCNLSLCFCDEAADIATSHVDRDRDPSLTPFAGDLRRTSGHDDIGQTTQRDLFASRSCNRNCRDGFGITAVCVGQSYDQWESQLSLKDVADRSIADRFDKIQNRRSRNAVASDLVLLDLDLQHRLTGQLSRTHIGRTIDAQQHPFDFGCLRCERIQVVAVQLHRDVGSATGAEFIESQFDRLGVGEPLARQVREALLEHRVSSCLR